MGIALDEGAPEPMTVVDDVGVEVSTGASDAPPLNNSDCMRPDNCDVLPRSSEEERGRRLNAMKTIKIRTLPGGGAR